MKWFVLASLMLFGFTAFAQRVRQDDWVGTGHRFKVSWIRGLAHRVLEHVDRKATGVYVRGKRYGPVSTYMSLF